MQHSPTNGPASAPRRIHITGGPGAGKTTVAALLGAALSLPVYDLDGMTLAIESSLPRPLDMTRRHGLLAAAVARVAETEAWITEGAQMDWAEPFFEQADVVIWVQAPARVCLYRIPMRHLKASLRRQNRFPGLNRLYRFWRWSRRWYADASPHGVNIFGTPNTLATLRELLEPYGSKVVVVRSQADLRALIERLETRSTET